jgi:hypothetical protein
MHPVVNTMAKAEIAAAEVVSKPVMRAGVTTVSTVATLPALS